MADTKISAAADPGPLLASDRVPLARAGNAAAYAATLAEIRAFASPYAVHAFSPATPASSQVLALQAFPVPVTFPAAFAATATGATSFGGSLVAATGSTAIAVQKCLAAADPTVPGNWIAAGAVTFGAGAHAATLTTAGGVALSFAAGDLVRLVAPASVDASLAGVFVTLAGDRV